MTGGTLRTGKAEIGVIQIFHLDACAFPFQNVLRVVASIACQAGVLAGEWITGLSMIELAGRGSPFHDVEVFTEMVGVAAHAVLASIGVFNHPSMKSTAGDEALPDFRMAAQTLKTRRAGSENVTGGAFGWPIQVVVRTGQRTRGDLCRGAYR